MRDYKRIPFKNLGNCRDLGGYGCENDGFIRFHNIYRADSPNRLTEEEWAKILKIGVRTVIDLRSESERAYMPYSLPDEIKGVFIPLMSGDIDVKNISGIGERASEAFGRSLSEGYTAIAQKSPERIAAALNAVGEGLDNGAVLYHCSVGKDRTGIISAMIYLLCGVSDEDIIADYQVTETYIENVTHSFVVPKSVSNSAPENMREFLTEVKKQKLFELVYENGFTKENAEKIRTKLIEK